MVDDTIIPLQPDGRASAEPARNEKAEDAPEDLPTGIASAVPPSLLPVALVVAAPASSRSAIEVPADVCWRNNLLRPASVLMTVEQLREQQAFCDDIIRRAWASGILAQRRASELFPAIHEGLAHELATGDPGQFVQHYFCLVAGLVALSGISLVLASELVELPATPVPWGLRRWFMVHVDAVLRSINLAVDQEPHPNVQYVELIAHLLLWPQPIDDARALPGLPTGLGLLVDAWPPRYLLHKPDASSTMERMADKLQTRLHRPWRQIKAAPHGSSARSTKKRDKKRQAQLELGHIAYELRLHKKVAPEAIVCHPRFAARVQKLQDDGLRVDTDPGRGARATAQWVHRLIDLYLKNNPEKPRVPRGPTPGPRW